jgi:hypothetical protein
MEAYTIQFDAISSTYSGKNGRCCCGCAGKHTYTKQYQEWASKDRGYEVSDDEVSDRGVKTIINRMNKLITQGYEADLQDTYISVDADERIYVAYFKKD